ncbi:MAG: ATP-binding protein, partial [Chthoniobacteraceae bacterium]
MTIDTGGNAATGPDKGSAPGPSGAALDEKVNILIVDDRADKLLALKTALEELNENLVLARSGSDALRCLLRQEFAVILLDVNMPVMDGFETAAMIRQRQRSELTPIIFVSAINNAENHVTRGYSLGAVDYILAPVVAEILRAKVSVFVDLHRKTAQIRRQSDERANRIRAEAARAEAEAARERSAFLAEASKILAGSFDPEETFAAMARHTVPRLADYCLFDVVDENGKLRTLAAAHRDPSYAARLRELREQLIAGGSILGAWEVLETGQTKVCQRFDPELAGASAGHGVAEALRELGIRSYILTPLRARGRTLGTLCVASAVERIFDEAEITLVEELSQRAGLALDNAALFQAAEHARQKAERASQAKDQFLAMLSHELRTPLTPVLNTVAFLEADEKLSEEVRSSMEVIRRNVELEARLIDDLLDLTRISKGKVQLNLETANAHHLLESALEICRSEIHEKHMEIALDLKAASFHLKADPARLQQIFWNLIKNAVKFTSCGGSLTLSTSNDPDGCLVVEVVDTGIGIEPSLLSRIFNAFEQVGEGERFGGLGLGLAITKALVEMHGGEVNAA